MQLHVCVENVFTSLERSAPSEMFSDLAHTEVTFPISRFLFIYLIFQENVCVYFHTFWEMFTFKSHNHKCLYADANRTRISIEMWRNILDVPLDFSLVSREGDYRVTYYPPCSAG